MDTAVLHIATATTPRSSHYRLQSQLELQRVRSIQGRLRLEYGHAIGPEDWR